MTIKEVEQTTGLTRSVIRFYEKEKLIGPKRNDNNGYREYSDEDVKNIKKIAYLRTLEVSIEDIRELINKNADLYEVIEKQSRILEDVIHNEDITNYITNYLCFIALSVEAFILLYVNELVRHITIILLADTVVLIGLLILACYRLSRK